jgi:CheY-like chemotaxis protein
MKKILIIEDDPVFVIVYERFLAAHGFAVTVARDGAAGLELLAASPPDAVLLDLMMPKVNGLTVLRTIRANPAFAELPVLVMTAAAIPTFVEQARAAGANRVFDKANDKPLAVLGMLHDLLHTTSDSHLIALAKSGNPESVLDGWPDRTV